MQIVRKKAVLFGSLILMAIVSVVVLLAYRQPRNPEATTSEARNIESVTEKPSGIPEEAGDSPAGMHGLWATNMGDPQKLMGISHYVFIAKIIKNLGDDPILGIGAEKQFEAEVVYNIKGNLQGEIIVNQFNAYDPDKPGAVGPVDMDVLPWLVPDNTYLLATRYNPERHDSYVVNPHSANVYLISENSGLSLDSLREVSRNDQRSKDLQEAYKNEIVFDNPENALNAYQSLTAEQKATLEAYWRGDIGTLDEPVPEQPEEVPEEPEEPSDQPSEYYGY